MLELSMRQMMVLKTSKKDFYHFEYQKRKDEICPFSILAFLQPTTVNYIVCFVSPLLFFFKQFLYHSI